MPSNEERGAYAVVEQKPVALVFTCPWCEQEQHVPIDWIIWSELWNGTESCCCPECDREVRFNEGVELD